MFFKTRNEASGGNTREIVRLNPINHNHLSFNLRGVTARQYNTNQWLILFPIYQQPTFRWQYLSKISRLVDKNNLKFKKRSRLSSGTSDAIYSWYSPTNEALRPNLVLGQLGFSYSKQAEIDIFPYCLVDYVSPMKGHLSSLTFLKAKFLFSILSGNLPKRLLTYYLSTTNAFKFLWSL